jgi:ferritin-like metal-binding protein YciE
MITHLKQLYFDQILDLHSAETQLLRMLPQMVAHASSPELRDAFRDELEDTRTQCARLATIRERHGIDGEAASCEVMKEMLLEIRRQLTRTVPGAVRDAVLIASGNRLGHYEIAGYGVAKAFADCLGFAEDTALLEKSLTEEAETDAAITKFATGGLFRSGMNDAASMAGQARPKRKTSEYSCR